MLSGTSLIGEFALKKVQIVINFPNHLTLPGTCTCTLTNRHCHIL